MKIWIIIGIIVVLLGAGYYFIFYGSGSSYVPPGISNNRPAPAEAPGPAPEASAPALTARDINPNLPQTPTFYLNTPQGVVRVKNFYLANPEVVEADELLLYSAKKYSINYAVGDSIFNINFINKLDAATRSDAEGFFLSFLGVDKASACKLSVWETVGDGPGKTTLSFCGSVLNPAPNRAPALSN